MFSGIVEAIGTVLCIETLGDCIHLNISPNKIFDDLKLGDSVSINGVCLTITQIFQDAFAVTIVPETLRVTNLGGLKVSSLVNLERSISLSSRIGGHYVQGHVDGVAEIIELEKDGEEALLLKIRHSPHLAKYIVNKGYIALDGMSITVIKSSLEVFTVTLIPHTQQVTIVKDYCVGTKVNIEVDILSKYLEKLIGGQNHAFIN